MEKGKAGFSLSEFLMAMVLAGVLLSLLGANAAEFARRHRLFLAGVHRGEDIRMAHILLEEELRRPDPLAPGPRSSGDSLALRSFRGSAIPCPDHSVPEEHPISRWPVRSMGLRRFDPGKDSVLALGADGGWTVHGVRSVPETSPSCPAPDWGGWEFSPPLLRPPAFFRWFEHVSYHLSDGTLRIRMGSGGRQPLTDSIFPVGSGPLLRVDEGGVIRIGPDGSSSRIRIVPLPLVPVPHSPIPREGA